METSHLETFCYDSAFQTDILLKNLYIQLLQMKELEVRSPHHAVVTFCVLACAWCIIVAHVSCSIWCHNICSCEAVLTTTVIQQRGEVKGGARRRPSISTL